MDLKFTIGLFLLFIYFPLNAQEGWFWQNPTLSEPSLTSVFFIDSLTGWTLGSRKIFKTTNAGEDWEKIYESDNCWLISVFFVDKNTGWAVGGSSTGDAIIIKTTDGGEGWTTQFAGGESVFESVFFINEKIGWVAGLYGTSKKTTDGGQTWNDVYVGSSSHLFSLVFSDINIGWVSGLKILKTTNSGTSWIEQFSGTNYYHSIFFINDSTGWAVGDNGKILHTSNGGSSWNYQSTGTTEDLYSVYFTNNLNGWAVGEHGTILQSIDGGNNWITSWITLNTALNFNYYGLKSVYFFNNNIGWIVGSGVIIKTANQGNEWQPYEISTANRMKSVYFIDTNIGWAVSDISYGLGPGIYKTTNGGKNWYYQLLGTSIKSIFFVNKNVGWAVGPQGKIFMTKDGGTNWSFQSFGSIYCFNSVHFVDENIGFIVGCYDDGKYNYPGVLLKTTNGGSDWSLENIGKVDMLNSVYFINQFTGWAVGETGLIINTTNGGKNWSVQLSESLLGPFYSICFADSITGLTGGGRGIFKTTDGGNNWFSQNINFEIFSVYLNNENIGWAVGSEGRILKTTNGGNEWLNQNSITDNWLYSVCFVDSFTGWAVGQFGTILKSTDGGITFIENNYNGISQPTSFALFPNYPNPFNPSTKISWQSPVGSWQTLKVYDILGREVATLVDEYKPAGRYEVEFNPVSGIGYPASGVYFYQLKAGDPSTGSGQVNVETRKMVLLK